MNRVWLLVWVASLSLLAQPPVVQEAPLRAHLSFLADDQLEGRGTGSRGGRLAVRYLEAQLQALGLQPANGDSFVQAVKMVGTRTLPTTKLEFAGPAGAIPLSVEADYVAGSGVAVPALGVDAPFLFVGHGISLGDRDDFKGMDVRGKILVAMVGDRPDQKEGCCTPGHLAGRWGYKLAEARRRGAAGILLIHDAVRAGYDWSVVRAGWTTERFQLDPAAPGAGLQGWLSNTAARKLFQAAGMDLDALSRQADEKLFQPISMAGLRLRGTVNSAVRHFEDMNVAGILPGTDPVLAKELVIYSAHWDHLGLDTVSGKYFNGAVDNASGCAGVLAIAQALAGKPSSRSQMFLFPCAEEHGLLGTEAFLAHPLWPIDRIAAAINLESLNFAGPTRDIGLAGSEGSTLHDLAVEVAKGMGLSVTPTRPDPSGLFFRSDHFPFIKAGVPAFSPGFSLDGGWDFQDMKDAAKAKGYVAKQYHKPADRYDPTWDLRGMLQQTQFTLNLGQVLSERPNRPQWKIGPFVW
ncbi:MAG: M28 family peptidase [Holophaga sp.]